MSRESGRTTGGSLVRQGYRSLAWDSEGQRQVGLRLCPLIGSLAGPQRGWAIPVEGRDGARRPSPRFRLTARLPQLAFGSRPSGTGPAARPVAGETSSLGVGSLIR